MTKNKKYVSIPFINQPPSFWESINKSFGRKIKEVYFPIAKEFVGTGRPLQPDKYLEAFLESQILPVSLLINPIVLPNQYQKLQKKLLQSIENYTAQYNLKGITVSNLDLAKDIKNYFPQLELTASTLMDISTEQQLLMVENVFDVLVPSTKVIRDYSCLKKLKTAFPGKIKILVNESCLPSCIYRIQHFFEMSTPTISYPCSLCNKLLNEKPWLRLTGSWILPQHINLIDGLFDELKLAGRVSLSEPKNYIKVLSAYLNQNTLSPNEIGGGPASVFLSVEISTHFYKTTLNCSKNCTSCTICKDYWDKNTVSYD